jgi:hypothetical protein
MNAKQRWNSEHYQQVNVSLPKELAEAFKTRCATTGMSVAGEIARLLREDLAMPPVLKKKAKPIEQKFDTRLDRRKAIKISLDQLDEIKTAETTYQESIPDSLKDTNGEGIDDAISALDIAIDELSGIEIYPEPPIRRKKRRSNKLPSLTGEQRQLTATLRYPNL